MREIPFIPEQKSHLSEEARSQYLTQRFPQLMDILDKLSEASWPVQLTITGLAFEPPLSDEKNDHEVIQDQLTTLGIDDECGSASRTLQEIQEAAEEYTDRFDYDGLDREFRDPTHHVCSDCEQGRLDRMAALEEQYGRRSLMIGSDFERGVLHGKLETLNWLLGEEWHTPFRRYLVHKGNELVAAAELAEQIRDETDEEDDDDDDACDWGPDD